MKRNRIIIITIFISLVFLAIFSTLHKIRKPEQSGILIEYTDSIIQLPVITEYGLPIDSFNIFSGIIQKNQVLAGILKEYNVPLSKINLVAEASRGIFDLRKVRYGTPYEVFCSLDSTMEVKYFVYEHSPVEYLMIALSDSVMVTFNEKTVRTEMSDAVGQIHSSLWLTMQQLEYDPMLAIELSEIYAWSIDFFGLQEDDIFKVIYEKQFVDTQYVALGKIHGAYFQHAGQDFYAIPFIQDSVEAFFDQDGNSLRKAFLKAPLRFSRISSRYSYNRLHPILKIRRPHLGVDYAAPVGTPVHAIGDGKIIQTSYTEGSGKMVKIRHNSVYTTAYLHLSHFAKNIQTGAYVKQGDVIGYVGSTGLSTGPHLDFRFYKNGYPVDPLKVEAPPVEPVKEENRAVYDSIKKLVISKLDQVNISRGIGISEGSEMH